MPKQPRTQGLFSHSLPKTQDERSSDSKALKIEQLEDRCVPAYVPVGSEFLVNTFTTGGQQYLQVAMDGSGNFVAAWISYGQTNGADIYAQRFNASGVKVGSEFRVNTHTTNDQLAPAVAMDNAGNFVITWTSKAQDGNQDGVYAQRYNSSGVAQGTEFRVNNVTRYNQNDSAIAMDPSGNFVITFSSGTQDPFASPNPQDGALYGVYAQRFNSSGAEVGGEFRVNTRTSGYEALPSIAMDNSGNFVIAWTSLYQDGENSGIYAQRYNASGVAQGGEFRVNSFTTRDQFFPSVAMDATGNFVVAWSSNHENASPVQTNSYARRYNSSGVAQGAEFRVNTYTLGQQLLATVAMDDAGNFVVTWSSGAAPDVSPPPQDQQDGNLYGVYAQRYTSAGAADGSEFQVNTYTTLSQFFQSVAMRPSNGDMVIAWSSGGQDGSGYGNYAQRFILNTAPTGHAGGPYTINEGDSLLLNGSGSSDPEGQALTYSWDVNGDLVFGDATGVSPTLTWSQLIALGIVDNGFQLVRVRVTDPYGLSHTSAAQGFTVVNGAPTANISLPPAAIVRGEPTNFTLTAVDPSPVDQAANFTFFIDWNGDFTFDETIVGPSGTVVSHVFASSGGVNIRVNAEDKDGGYSNTFAQPITVVDWAVKANGGLMDLVWGGTNSAESLLFQVVSGNVEVYNLASGLITPPISGVTGNVVVYMQGGDDLVVTNGLNGANLHGGDGNDALAPLNTSGGNYTLSGGLGNDQLYFVDGQNFNVTMIGGDGDDEMFLMTGNNIGLNMQGGDGFDALIIVDGSNITANMDGGADDDSVIVLTDQAATMTILGGSGDDFILAGIGADSLDGGTGSDLVIGGVQPGADGADTILGGDGNDVLIGHLGADVISGGIGEDLILTGSVDLIYFGDEPTPGIVQVWDQWRSADPLATRVAYLTGTPGGIIDPMFTIIPGTTVLDDGAVDIIAGNEDGDWLIYDWVQDLSLDYLPGTDIRTNI